MRCVLTARDVPHNVLFSDVPGQTTTVGPLRARTQVLAEEVVRFLGEPVALVAAETEEAAEEAARRVTVEYADLPGVFDPEAAMHPDAPRLEPTGNVISRWKIRKGDVEAGFREADVVVERSYRTPFIDHAFIEPEAGVAWLDENGVITIRVATQVIEHFRDVANVLGLPHSRVRIIAPYIGGGFGGQGGRHGRGVPRAPGLEDHAAGPALLLARGVDHLADQAAPVHHAVQARRPAGRHARRGRDRAHLRRRAPTRTCRR